MNLCRAEKLAADLQCRRCGCAIREYDAVHLWDGCNYCERCVESQLPGLADYARQHDVLCDQPPKEALDTARGTVRMGVILAIVASLPFAVAGFQNANWQGAVGGIVIAIALALIVTCIKGPVHAQRAQLFAPTVRMHNGLLTIERRVTRAGGAVQVPFADIRWREGKASADSELRKTTISNCQLVLLECVFGPKWFRLSERVACGWSQESRRRWIAFLTLAGAPRASKWPMFRR